MAQTSPFWTFSLQTYGSKGVPAACLRLQDQCGVDVNILLFCLFLARQGRALTLADLVFIDASLRDWRLNGVVKLREVRRFLKQAPQAFAALDVDGLRDRVKAIELEAERLQQEALYALRPVPDWGHASPFSQALATDNMQAYAQWLGVVFPLDDLAPLLSAVALDYKPT